MWESDKEIMYNMTDALISPESLAMLLGSDPVHYESKAVHKKETMVLGSDLTATLEHDVDTDSDIFVFHSEHGNDIGDEVAAEDYSIDGNELDFTGSGLTAGDRVIVDYYYLATTTTMTVEVDKFAGYYYLEAETLWRREHDGEDLPAIFTMPRIKFASNFTFENTSSGDPAEFEFNAEAFPDSDGQMVIIDVIEDVADTGGE